MTTENAPENKQGAHRHPKANNTSWKPGQSGNPKGYVPKGYSISEAFKAMLGAEPETKRKIVNAIKEKAEGGDMNAAKLIWEYMDGKPKQPIVGGDEDDPPVNANLTVRFVGPPNTL